MSDGGQFGLKPAAAPKTQRSTASTFLCETVQRLGAMTNMDSGAARELMSLGIRFVFFAACVQQSTVGKTIPDSLLYGIHSLLVLDY